MPLVYNSNNRIFIKQEQQKHSGKSACYSDSPVESFWINHFVDSSQYDSSFFEFDTPLYYTLGGTINYYGQDYWSVFTNIYRPFIRFTFTANTDYFGTGTTIKHNIYRITYKDYIEYSSEIVRKNIEQNTDYSTETVEETTTDGDGNTSTTTTTKKTTLSNTTEKTAPKNFPETVSNFNLDTIDQNEKIKSLLSAPFYTITAATTAITSYTYILFLDEYVKSTNGFQEQMFQDYAQYFITTQFEFIREQAEGLTDFYQLDAQNKIVSADYQQYYQEITPVDEHVITGGTFSGITVYGNFFTYFLIPNKPVLETPYVSGQLTTFSPTFFWSHTDDGDSFLLQVTYCSGDCQTFSGTSVYSYPIDKESSCLTTEEMLSLPTGDWSIAQKKTDVIRQYSVPLAYGQTFWYRIGNVKELINIFGVKQKAITFSEITSAITASLSYDSQVYVQADSPHTEETSVLTYPEYLVGDVTAPPTYTLSGSVSGSVVAGATMLLTYPNGNQIQSTTDSFGNFIFSNLDAGTYGIGTIYRGYKTKPARSTQVVITGNTTMSPILLELSWDNIWDKWQDVGDHLMGEG